MSTNLDNAAKRLHGGDQPGALSALIAWAVDVEDRLDTGPRDHLPRLQVERLIDDHLANIAGTPNAALAEVQRARALRQQIRSIP